MATWRGGGGLLTALQEGQEVSYSDDGAFAAALTTLVRSGKCCKW